MLKTETKMLKVIADYGKVLNGFGVKNPVFLMTNECYKAIANPDGLEFEEKEWTPIYDLPEEIKNTPGVCGMYRGVILKRVYLEAGSYAL